MAVNDPDLYTEYSVDVGEIVRSDSGTLHAVVIVRLHGSP